jgi:uncharacterized RDD family membrane protein YckC
MDHGTNHSALQIQTPEGVIFALTLAGPISRFLAWIIDVGCLLVAWLTLSKVVQLLSLVSEDVGTATVIISFFVLSTGYGIAFEWLWRGQTIGKRVVGLHVMDESGLRLQFSQVVIRNLLRMVDRLPAMYFLGGFTCIVNAKHQRLGDIAAGTIVVRAPKIGEPRASTILSGKFNSFREFPHLEARLRQKIGPEEAAKALQAILRRDELEGGARIAVFRDIADFFREIVPFPGEATRGVTDEQYVRNVLDSVYNSRKRPDKESTDTEAAEPNDLVS